MSSYCWPAFTVSDKKSAINLIGVPLYAMNNFSLTLFKIFLFIFGFQHFHYDVSDCVSFWAHYSWKLLSFLETCRWMLMIKFGSFCHYLKKIFVSFFSSPSGIPITHMLVPLIVSFLSLNMCSFFFISSFFCFSDCVISIDPSSRSLNLSSVSSDLLLRASTSYCTFQLQKLNLGLFNNFIDIFYLMKHLNS